MRTLLVAHDLTEYGDAAANAAARFAQQGDHVLLVHVHAVEVVPPEHRSDAVTSIDEEVAKRLLEKVVERIQTLAPEVRFELRVGLGRPIDELLAIANQEQAQLIVVGTHGRTGLERLVLGSVAEEVVRRASCPVMVAKPPAED